MDFLLISYGFPMDFLWISHGFPTDSLSKAKVSQVFVTSAGDHSPGVQGLPGTSGGSACSWAVLGQWVVSYHAKNHQTSGKFVDLYKPTW